MHLRSMAVALTVTCALAGAPAAASAATIELITNGGFETGTFAGWTTVTTSTPFIPWLVSPAGAGAGFGMAATAPQEGVFDAWNGFDGLGPMEFQLYQDVTVPDDSTAVLSWMHRAQWNFLLTSTATLPRLFDVEIRDPLTDLVLATLFSFSTGTAFVIGDTGWLTTSVDVSSFAGSTIRVLFRERIPEQFTGPAQIEFDAISLQATPIPEPATLLLLGTGLGAAAARRRLTKRR